MEKVYIETYGCQMNFADSEVVGSILRGAGHELSDSMEEADFVLINTCAIRDNAEQRVRHRVRELRAAQGRNKSLRIGILGCMAERLQSRLMAEEDNVSFVCGPDAYRRLPALLAQVREGQRGTEVELSTTETYADIEPVRLASNGISAYISIMRGCQNYCSYCVVPYTRGAERSRDAHSIVREACDVYQKGYKEVTLLGQNVDSYLWKNETETVNFASLLERVAAIAPDLRVRFATSHPKDISDEVLYTMAAHPNICKHIHLPVQSGSTRMLDLMRRKYSREWYLERVAKIREVMPECGLTTDVIAGFCTETLQDHEDTLSLMEAVGFDWAFMFAYSDRPGTLANRTMKDDVPAPEKNRRLNQIIELQNRKSLERYRAQIGKELEVLVEGPSKRDPDRLCGRASNNMMCVFPAAGRSKGTYTTVRVLDCTSATLICE